jgi:NAD(P)-dependent dehydrogenase (short-subunit alcohol dehydrogenase family)
MEELRFDGRVAIVTGAGRGIGRAHALLLAARGAHVVVNDFGVAMDGVGNDDSPARRTVEAIRAGGGSAECDTSDISSTDGVRKLVDTALSKFGRIDVLVNNAGIYTMDQFPAMDAGELVRQLNVHVCGGFLLAQACWDHMTGQSYGRIVFTTSTGALGSGYLTAYGVAKAGVFGLARALAMVAASGDRDIKVNAVAPMAFTRMMAARSLNGADPDPDPERHPDLVSPVVAWLAHERCPVNGETIMGGMRRYSRLFVAETQGYVHPDLEVTPEVMAEHWDAIFDPGRAEVATDTASWSERNRQAIESVPFTPTGD